MTCQSKTDNRPFSLDGDSLNSMLQKEGVACARCWHRRRRDGSGDGESLEREAVGVTK